MTKYSNTIVLDSNQDVLSSVPESVISELILYRPSCIVLYVNVFDRYYFLLKTNDIYEQILSILQENVAPLGESILYAMFSLKIILLFNPGYCEIVAIQECEHTMVYIQNSCDGNVKLVELITKNNIMIKQRSRIFNPGNNSYIIIDSINGNNQMVTCNTDSNLLINAK